MARKAKLPERRSDWYRLKRSYKSFGREQQYDVTMDTRYGGMGFEDLRREMDEIQAEFGAEFERFKIETDTEHQYDGEIIVTRVYGFRAETDAEYQARLDADAAHVAARKQREREEFDRLVKKFGKTA
jgi:hypothetical protein